MKLQKASPYLEDANELIHRAVESGLIAEKMKEHLPNATQCVSHADVQRSHFGKGQLVVFRMDNIYGMLILLAIGLGVAAIIVMVEMIVHKASTRTKELNMVIVI